MAPRGSPELRARRVASIVKMQSLLFGRENPDEYESLLDFDVDRRPAKVERVISVLRAQEAILGGGLYLQDEESRTAAAEIPSLVSYLRSLLDAGRGPARKLTVLPRNLGRPFAAKRWGLPLFGDFRPASPPEQGILLVYSSMDGDGRRASVAAARLGPGIRLAYEGRALAVESRSPWLSLDARFADDPSPSGSGGRDEYRFSRYALWLDRRPRLRRFPRRAVDPYEYEYGYLFYPGPGAGRNVARFVSDLLSGIFHVPLRESERIGWEFSGRSP